VGRVPTGFTELSPHRKPRPRIYSPRYHPISGRGGKEILMEKSIRSIVVAVAELEGDDPELAAAVALAEALDARLYAVHAHHVPDFALAPYPEMNQITPEVVGQLREITEKR